MIYYHIGDKKVLYSAVLHSRFGNLAALIAESMNWQSSPEENLRTYIRVISVTVKNNPLIPPIMMREVAAGGANLPKEVINDFIQIFEILKRILDQGEKQGIFIGTVPFIIHFMTVGPIVFLQRLENVINMYATKLGPGSGLGRLPEDIGQAVETLILNAVKTESKETHAKQCGPAQMTLESRLKTTE